MHSTPSLSELQQGFLAAMADTGASPLEACIDARGIDPAARLRIYRNATLAIHVEALATTFPAVATWIGEDTFDGVATRHAARIGSRSGNLQNVGADFAGFLTEQPEMTDYTWLHALAQLEWLRQTVLLAPIVDGAPRTRMPGPLDTGDMLQPHVRWLHATVPALDLWRCAQQPDDASMPALDQSQDILLWREDAQVCMCETSPGTAVFLQHWTQEAPLQHALRQSGITDAAAGPALMQPLLQHQLLLA